MNNVSRVISMLFVWGAALLIAIAAMFSPARFGGNNFEALPIVVVMLICSTVATGFIWRNPDEMTASHPTPERLEKAKRDPRGRLIQLINTMDDDEAAELLSDMRQRLSTPNADGEISTIDSLLKDYERTRGRN